MGLPVDSNLAPDTRDTANRSYSSQSSDDCSLLRITSITSSVNTCSRGSFSQSSTTPLLLGSPMQGHLPQPSVASPASSCQLCCRWDSLSEEEKLKELVRTVFRQPDSIRWQTPTRRVKLERNGKGSLGFKYTNVKGKISSYTLISEVFHDGSSFGIVGVGECILSVNGQPLNSEEGITLRSVVSVDKDKPVYLIIQRPEAINCGKKCQRYSLQRSVSSERLNGDMKTREALELEEGMDSGNSSHTSLSSSDKRDALLPKSLEHRLSALANSGNVSRLDTLMPRLPFLRILISGSQAETLATSLVGPSIGQALSKSNDVGVYYQACLSRIGSKLSLAGSQEEPKKWVTELLESVAGKNNLKPNALSDRIELEIIALKSHPFSAYCQHILATAHSIFVIQFSCHDFLSNERSVLLDIQRRLNKIRTYTSNRAPVYLVMSVDNSLPSDQLTAIGQRLHRQFAKAFMNQLQYNSTTNCPCFQVVGANPANVSRSSTDLHRRVDVESNSDRGQCRIIPSKKGNSLDVSYWAGNSIPMGIINPQDRGFEMSSLRDHILHLAFKQPFITDCYPYLYLLHRERVHRLKENGLHYAFKAGIKKECQEITSEKELHNLLSFLHHCGDIICADFLPCRSSNSTLFRITSNNVLLDRYHLIMATKQLTTIPSRSEQQDPRFPNSMHHWEELGQSSLASSAFLEHLLRYDPKNDPGNLLTTLGLMGLIHCLQQPEAESTKYLVPFFLPQEALTTSPPRHGSSSSYRLCLDFHGSLPDAFFLAWLVHLMRKVFETHGRWRIDGPNSAQLSLANDCEMDVSCDEVESLITISARCGVNYNVHDLLALTSNIVDQMRSTYIKSSAQITIGPPCPLQPYYCKVRAGEPEKTHVIDIANGKAPGPLWCGDQQVDCYPDVDQWLLRATNIMQLSSSPSNCPSPVSLCTHIKKLPPALFVWLCNRLNAPPVGRDWQGLAGVLGYNLGDVTVFKIHRQSVSDPCYSLLLDWGRHANATLGELVHLLREKPMERLDILTDMMEKWLIVQ
ncbi:uncharacterized protein LOC110982973 [Acanthaster planci]|uniref:Uncharacterized protein LOC110982973 n=1 Tax=Acanthaster planci TaxID=133434 RepID=A0A8B7YW10_ACAPL|nr:uncharacterized protein LOC110982973 [Acanthaster planci]XP_022097504.1 uncharacterized protein LOC110982973 [Acanthaster planci]